MHSKKRVRARTHDVAFKFRMDAGIPGDVNRSKSADVVTEIGTPGGSTNGFASYGVAVVLDGTTHQARLPAAGDAAADIYGLLARPYPTVSSQDGLGTSTPPGGTQVFSADVLKRGFMTVKLSGATAAAKFGQVFVRIQNAGAGQFVGGLEAAADGANTVTLAKTVAYFMGPADANGNVEVAFGQI